MFFNSLTNPLTKNLFFIPPIVISIASAALAQPITPANDGTGTVVAPEGDRIDINGGQLSGDGANLFHSFEEFGLSEGQIANFLSNPNIDNILGRVVGGDASYINGLLQVTGGDSNLFLINPAGIIFGESASLNVGGDFTATTATGIGFGNNWLDAFGTNSWSSLVGNPTAFEFAMANPGSIVNEGNLAVSSGQNLGLFGGSVVNTGTLTTSDGNLTLMAVEGESLVRLSAAGNVLSLDVAGESGIGSEDFTPLSLPQLLAGGEDFSHASQVAVNADGTVSLVGSTVEIDPQSGTAIASGELTANGNASTIQVLGNQVAVFDATLDVSGIDGGGEIFLGGDFQGNGTIPNAQVTFVDRNTNIFADALETGDGGRIILWADDTTAFLGNISARGATFSPSPPLPFGRRSLASVADAGSDRSPSSSHGGFVEVSGKQNLIFDGTVDLSASGGNLGTLLLDPTNITISNDPSTPATVDGFLPDILAGDFDTEDITINAATLASQTGNILLEATNDITLADGVSLNFAAGGSIAFTADSDNTDGGAFAMNSGSSIETNGRSLTILAGDNITTTDITTGGGELTLTSNNGGIDTTNGTIDTTGSAVMLSASGGIFTGEISTVGLLAGDITLSSSNGEVNTVFGTLNANGDSSGSGGTIEIDAELDIITADITADGVTGGRIDLNSRSGSIDTTFFTVSASGDLGEINLLAANDIITGNISTVGSDFGGTIALESLNGSIDTTLGTLDASSGFLGGDVTLTATNDVFTGSIDVSGSFADGNLSITSQTGDIEIQNITIADGGTDDPFTPPPSNPIADADLVSTLTGNVQLEAHNDITVNEAIVSSTLSNLVFKAGRNIFINADIDTSGSNGNLTLQANNTDLDPARREDGTGSIVQVSGTRIDAGSGNILVELGTQGDVGEILLPDINTTGTVSVDSHGDVSLASQNPLNLGNVSISGDGDLSVFTDGDLTVTGDIDLEGDVFQGDATGDITLESSGAIDAGGSRILSSGSNSGNITLLADGDITTGEVATQGETNSGDITLISATGSIDTTALGNPDGVLANLDSFSFSGDGGNITLLADGDITTFQLLSLGQNNSGDLSLISTNGNITTTVNPDLFGDVAIDSFSVDGDAGDITLLAFENVITEDISASSINGDGGDLDFFSGDSIITGSVSTFSEQGAAGSILLEAFGDITTEELSAFSDAGNAGSISLASGGSIATWELSTSSEFESAGNILLDAVGDITTGQIVTRGDIRSGDITLTSSDGSIDTTVWGNIDTESANIDSFSFSGDGGNVTLSADGDITTSQINSQGLTSSGNISLTSSNGNITNSVDPDLLSGLAINSLSEFGEAGDVTLQANGDITSGQIVTQGDIRSGDITLTSSNGNIDTTALGNPEAGWANLDSFSPGGDGGNVTLSADGNITTFQIISQGLDNSGDIALTSTSGNITTTVNPNLFGDAAIDSISDFGNAGSVTIAASGNVETGDIASRSQTGTGGDVGVTSSNGNITTGDIETFTNSNGDGGSITLQSNITADSSITTGNLQTESVSGSGGNISLTAFTSVMANDITTFSTLDSGDIDIRILNTENGEIATGNITTETTAGVSGDITVNGFNIATGNISSIGSTGSGDITIDAGGTITTLDIATITETGDSGNIDIDAVGDIQTGDITSSGGDNSGDIEVTSSEGSVTTGDITSEAGTGTAGDITVEASGDINTGDITSVGGEASGDVSLETDTGEINTGEVTTDTGDVIINGEVVGAPQTPPPTAVEEVDRTPTAPIDSTPQVQPQPLDRAPVLSITEEIAQTIVRDSSLNPAIAANIRNSKKIARDRTSEDSSTSNRRTSELVGNFNILGNLSLGIDIGEVAALEQQRTNEYTRYFGGDGGDGEVSIANTKAALAQIAAQTGNQSAVVYVTLLPEQIELVLLTPDRPPIRQVVANVEKDEVLTTAKQLRRFLTHPRFVNSDRYLESAQKLYQWLIAPLEDELTAAKTDTLLFSMDEGLRTLPVAALHDGQQFLVENYSFSLIPSLSLIDTRYRALQNTQALGMGASTFETFNSLPAVPVELATITQEIWQGEAFLNEDFTRANLVAQRQEFAYPIVHLATHGEFKAGDPSNSFIQLWDEKLHLDELRTLGWHNPAVELLVLSACQTAVGDPDAELGFAGLAVAAGVKSAMASLWYVSDEGTLALMTEFYRHLADAPIKAEALRQAQIAMIRGEVRVEGGQLRGSGVRGSIPLPPELADANNTNLSHPYYWSAFTTIGSPW